MEGTVEVYCLEKGMEGEEQYILLRGLLGCDVQIAGPYHSTHTLVTL